MQRRALLACACALLCIIVLCHADAPKPNANANANGNAKANSAAPPTAAAPAKAKPKAPATKPTGRMNPRKAALLKTVRYPVRTVPGAPTAVHKDHTNCVKRVTVRCNTEKERCERDCEMYADGDFKALKCPKSKCKHLEQACLKIYGDVCEEYDPTQWVPLDKIDSVATESKKQCEERIVAQCDKEFKSCKRGCARDFADSDGADACHPLRCTYAQRDCLERHAPVCQSLDSLIVADHVMGTFCQGKADGCWEPLGYHTARIANQCNGGDCAARRPSWSDVSSCAQCQRATASCFEYCAGQGCSPRMCRSAHKQCEVTCPWVRAVVLGTHDKNSTALAKVFTVKAVVDGVNKPLCNCGASNVTAQGSCHNPCADPNEVPVSLLPEGAIPGFADSREVLPNPNLIVIDPSADKYKPSAATDDAVQKFKVTGGPKVDSAPRPAQLPPTNFYPYAEIKDPSKKADGKAKAPETKPTASAAAPATAPAAAAQGNTLGAARKTTGKVSGDARTQQQRDEHQRQFRVEYEAEQAQKKVERDAKRKEEETIKSAQSKKVREQEEAAKAKVKEAATKDAEAQNEAAEKKKKAEEAVANAKKQAEDEQRTKKTTEADFKSKSAEQALKTEAAKQALAEKKRQAESEAAQKVAQELEDVALAATKTSTKLDVTDTASRGKLSPQNVLSLMADSGDEKPSFLVPPPTTSVNLTSVKVTKTLTLTGATPTKTSFAQLFKNKVGDATSSAAPAPSALSDSSAINPAFETPTLPTSETFTGTEIPKETDVPASNAASPATSTLSQSQEPVQETAQETAKETPQAKADSTPSEGVVTSLVKELEYDLANQGIWKSREAREAEREEQETKDKQRFSVDHSPPVIDLYESVDDRAANNAAKETMDQVTY